MKRLLTLAALLALCLLPAPLSCSGVCLTSADCGAEEWCSLDYHCAALGGDADPCPLSLADGDERPCFPGYLCVVAVGGHDYDGTPVCQPRCDVCSQIHECAGSTPTQAECSACGCPEEAP